MRLGALVDLAFVFAFHFTRLVRYIAGEAVIAADSLPITKDSPVTFDRKQVPYFSSRLPLREIVRYEPGRVGQPPTTLED